MSEGHFRTEMDDCQKLQIQSSTETQLTQVQRKTYKKKKKLASSKNNLRAKKDFEANLRRFCAQAIAKLQPEKSRNVAFGTH